MSGTKRRRPGTAESPEEARGHLIRKLFLLYDGYPFRDALRRLGDRHGEVLANSPVTYIDLAFGRDPGGQSEALADYVAATSHT